MNEYDLKVGKVRVDVVRVYGYSIKFQKIIKTRQINKKENLPRSCPPKEWSIAPISQSPFYMTVSPPLVCVNGLIQPLEQMLGSLSKPASIVSQRTAPLQ